MQTFDERRVATIMFVDMCGYTAFIGDEDPEDVARVLEQLKRIASEVVDAYGGMVNQFVGDEIVALFGVRQSYEDDACRAVTAALVLHERAREMAAFGARRERRCVLHSGVETGLVLARSRDIRAGVYDVVGEPVNLAARLRSHAGSDEILLGPRTQSLVAPFFVTEARPAFLPRGMNSPIVPVRVLGPSSAQRPFDAALRRGLTGFVGREVELTRIVQIARTAEHGEGGCLSVSGPPGMGKTRLLYEAQRRIRSVLSRIPHVLVGRCAPYGRAEPYRPFIDALQKLLEELVEDASPPSVSLLLHYGAGLSVHLPVFAYLLGSHGEHYPAPRELVGERLRAAIVDALAALLEALSRQGRLVVWMLEDWHTADEGSDAALRQLVERFAARRVLFVISFRSTELHAAAVPSRAHLDLLPLDRLRTSQVAAAMLQTAEVQQDLAGYIHERTLGNPFFVEEVCRALIETDKVTRRGDLACLTCPIEQLETPGSVQAMVRARIDRLAPAAKELLRLASVLGVEFAFDALHVLARSSARLAPRQGEVAEVRATPRGAALPLDEPPGPVARQLRELLTELDAHGLIYAARAGEQPRYRFQHAITCEVAYADLPLEERRAHHERIGRALEQRHEGALEPWYDVLAFHYGASASIEKAASFAELAGDRALRAFSLDQAMNSYRSAINGLDRSAQGDALKQHKRVQLSLKWAACCVFNPAREQVGVLAVSLAWARELGDARGVVRCLCWMAWLSHVVGEQQRAVELYEQARTASAALHDEALLAQIEANIGLSYAMAARHGEALALLSSSVARRKRADAHGIVQGTTPLVAGGGYGYTLAYLGMIAGDRGQFAEAHALLAEGLSIVEATGRLALIGAVLVLRAMVESWQHDWLACSRTATEARGLAERVNGGYLRAMTQTLTGASRVLGADDLAGLEPLRSAVAWLDMHQILLSMSWNEAWLAESLLRARRWEEAEQHARRALLRASAWDALGEVAALRVLAVTAVEREQSYEQAHALLDCARDQARARGSRRELLLTELTCATLRVRQGEAGALLELERAHDALRELGVGLPPPTAR
jgi:class 3 adenylate cyclase/tetratricopeptide (TPR) repeat protein